MNPVKIFKKYQPGSRIIVNCRGEEAIKRCLQRLNSARRLYLPGEKKEEKYYFGKGID